jgi:hypothetical protein
VHEILRNDLPNIMHEKIDDEVVVVNLDNGTYYSFDGVGGRIWEWLGGGRTLNGLIAAAQSSFSGDAAAIASSVKAFVDQLRTEQLLNVVNGEPGEVEPGLAAVANPPAFAAPSLQKYTDMEALLLADPVHEVDEASGWPNLK